MVAFTPETPQGRYVYYGVREHAMGAAMNGMALYGGVIPYGGTFLVFFDYVKPAVRLAALMSQRVIYVFTHDSIGLGEDGPTHQPIEHLAALRAIPNVTVIRPADANETAYAWKAALENKTGPTALALTRQALPTLDRGVYAPAEESLKGAYILKDYGGEPHVILMASGSEVPIIMNAAEQLVGEGIAARVVSFPSWELFEKQPQAYRESVFPASIRARVAVEAAATFGWHRWIGSEGAVIGLDHFGASAPFEILYREFGITAERVVQAAKQTLG
ncbi:MAG: transketolase, partial [Anaerolineales bacterium]|nr:transketolase [Anaerolineales bacterium]